MVNLGPTRVRPRSIFLYRSNKNSTKMVCIVPVPWDIPDCNVKSNSSRAVGMIIRVLMVPRVSRNTPRITVRSITAAAVMPHSPSWMHRTPRTIAPKLRPYFVKRVTDSPILRPIATMVVNAKNTTKIRIQSTLLLISFICSSMFCLVSVLFLFVVESRERFYFI